MQVNQEDYEDKLNTINRLNREVESLRKRVDTIKHQRDTVIDALTILMETVTPYMQTEAEFPKLLDLVKQARQQMGQSEMM